MPFPPGTTDVSSQQIAEISTWVERTSASGLRFDAVLVEGFAPSSASDAHALADSRTRKVARMIRTFTGNTLPISAHATIASGSATEDDEAVIQWVPSAPADVPGCPEPR
ncbi:MAG: hypothetical protein JSR41_12800 [Proteobacteria bacterium]|nr:hypothetical protein [Pseudomonadota bacterium]